MPLNEVWKITPSGAECVEAFDTPDEAGNYLLSNGATFAGYDSGVYMFNSAIEPDTQYAVQDISNLQ